MKSIIKKKKKTNENEKKQKENAQAQCCAKTSKAAAGCHD